MVCCQAASGKVHGGIEYDHIYQSLFLRKTLVASKIPPRKDARVLDANAGGWPLMEAIRYSRSRQSRSLVGEPLETRQS